MQMIYETKRLCLRILTEESAPFVLHFYAENRDVFEAYEVDRPLNFYTEEYQRAV